LCLGDEIAFPEMYTYSYPEVPMKVGYPTFFDQRFLSLLHRMVYWWYSTYKNVIKSFVSMELQELLFRERKEKGKRLKIQGSREKLVQQTLIVFPDNRTRYNMLSDEQIKNPDMLQLFSTDSQARKDTNWRKIKKGEVQTIVATQSEVFQPFINLKKIIFVDPQKWYYNNQQDPRYSLQTVVKKMAEIYGAELIEVSDTGSLAFEE
jgi:hypothetical protein